MVESRRNKILLCTIMIALSVIIFVLLIVSLTTDYSVGSALIDKSFWIGGSGKIFAVPFILIALSIATIVFSALAFRKDEHDLNELIGFFLFLGTFISFIVSTRYGFLF